MTLPCFVPVCGEGSCGEVGTESADGTEREGHRSCRYRPAIGCLCRRSLPLFLGGRETVRECLRLWIARAIRRELLGDLVRSELDCDKADDRRCSEADQNVAAPADHHARTTPC